MPIAKIFFLALVLAVVAFLAWVFFGVLSAIWPLVAVWCVGFTIWHFATR